MRLKKRLTATYSRNPGNGLFNEWPSNWCTYVCLEHTSKRLFMLTQTLSRVRLAGVHVNLKSRAINRSFDSDCEICFDMDGDVKPLSKKRISELEKDSPPVEFFADHPFLFLIVDPTTNFHPIRLIGRYAGWATISQKEENQEAEVKEDEAIYAINIQQSLIPTILQHKSTVVVVMVCFSVISFHSPCVFRHEMPSLRQIYHIVILNLLEQLNRSQLYMWKTILNFMKGCIRLF